MEVQEIINEGLQRQMKVVLPAHNIVDQVEKRLKKYGSGLKIPGFRPGKIPMNVLKKRYGTTALAEAMEDMVNQCMEDICKERDIRPALPPKVDIGSFDETMDLEFTVTFEILPSVPEVDFKAISLEIQKPTVTGDDVEEMFNRFKHLNRKFEDAPEGAKLQEGDMAVVDFDAHVDGKAFTDSSSKDFHVNLGSNLFIPEIEKALVGSSAGDTKDVEVVVPETNPDKDVVGKKAVYRVSVKHIKVPVDEQDDTSENELMKGLKDMLEKDLERLAFSRAKQALLDKLADMYDFDIPQGMIDLEFDSVWKNVQDDKKEHPDHYKGRAEEDLKEEYLKLCKRRICLAILLSEMARREHVHVSERDMQQAIYEEAQRYPQQADQVIQYYKNTPEAVKNLHGPIIEDKMVKLLLERVDLKETEVSSKEFLQPKEDQSSDKKKASTKQEKTPKAVDKVKSSKPKKEKITEKKKEESAKK